MDKCVMCGKDLPTECELMYCGECLLEVMTPKFAYSTIEIPKNNVELSFNGGNTEVDFLVGYRRTKSLNWFQIWMFKVCFGIRARNV